jgi:hypothetical protein
LARDAIVFPPSHELVIVGVLPIDQHKPVALHRDNFLEVHDLQGLPGWHRGHAGVFLQGRDEADRFIVDRLRRAALEINEPVIVRQDAGDEKISAKLAAGPKHPDVPAIG